MRDDHDCIQTASTDAAVSRVSVLAADRELADAVPDAERPRAQRAMWTAGISFPAGRIDLAVTAQSSTVFALLVVNGVLTRHTGLGDRGMIELMLTGDVLSPWPWLASAPLTETYLTSLDGVQLAILDHTFIKAAAVWPSLMVVVQRRLDEQQHRLAMHGAICQLPRVEQRVLAIMWLLAGRMGTVTPDGTELSFDLTHDTLARLTGSRRPTVSLAVKRLRECGYLERRDNGAWLLPQAPASLMFDARLVELPEV